MFKIKWIIWGFEMLNLPWYSYYYYQGTLNLDNQKIHGFFSFNLKNI